MKPVESRGTRAALIAFLVLPLAVSIGAATFVWDPPKTPSVPEAAPALSRELSTGIVS